MISRTTAPLLCFVWQASDVDATVLEIDKTGAGRIVVDVSTCPDWHVQDFGSRIENVDIKISLQQFFSPAIHDCIKEKNIRSVWVEYFPELCDGDINTLLERAQKFRNLNIVTGDVALITHLFKNSVHTCGLALKGSEAAGFVGTETTLTLLSYVERLAREYSFQPQVHVWGGAARPEAVAALLASGIQSVVFESLHWLTEGFIRKYPAATKQLAQLRVEHSRCVRIRPKLFFRAFDKGNSRALKELLSSGGDSDPRVLQKLSGIVLANSHVLESDFDSKRILPLGVEAAFADSFRHRFGETITTAAANFSIEIEKLVAQTANTMARFLSGPITGEMKIVYPFIQGGMACITDGPDFALTIARAGGLPTIAFGMQSPMQIEAKYAGLSERLSGFSYAINILALPENPYRDAQLSWILKNPPPFVVISAGDPAFAAQLQEQGIQTIFVTSDVDLLQLAWKRGVRYVVCEGNEAGGHVGELSMLTLAQAVMEVKKKNPETPATSQRLILAGGIFDPMSVFRAAALGADAVQMGTAYLATTEIVADGALGKVYQRLVLDSAIGDTIVTGESVGLRVRSLVSPKIAKIQNLERQLATAGAAHSSLRKDIEKEAGGSLYIAARGIDPASGEAMSEKECQEQGQFMSGTVAGMLSQAFSVSDFHSHLATSDLQPLLHRTQPSVPLPSASLQRKERLAITGMAVSNALGNSPEEVWQACIEMKSGIGMVPTSRWDHSRYYSRSGNYQGKSYCRVGAFLSLDISRKELGVSPQDFRTMTDSTRLTLWLAQKAIEDSGILSSDIPRDRIGVIVSQNSGESGSTMEDLTLSLNSEAIARSVQERLGLDPAKMTEIEEIIKTGRIAIDDTTLLGRLNCTAGGFICNKYGFTGPSYSVSAACATGLVALYSAVQLIRNNVLDAAIVGGGEELLHPASYLEFSALGALAGRIFPDEDPARTSRPFDRNRDGMVLGEGGAMIVIERESLAAARKRKSYAYITGVGASNNHRGMVESVAETQQLAIQASFRDAGYGAEQVDMVECHATATPTGDIQEVKALKAIYPQGNSVILGSFKSQIGHTLGTSGLNSLIRGVWAMGSAVYPPTLNYETVDPQIDLESWGFRVCSSPERWPGKVGRPRRLQVNAFGFGGANYVVQLEESDWTTGIATQVDDGFKRPVSGILPPAPGSLGVKFYRTTMHGRHYRIGSCREDGSVEKIKEFLKKQISTPDGPTDIQQKMLLKEGLSLALEEEISPFAFIFAGQGTHYSQMGRELYETFPTIRLWMDTIAELADFDILHMLFHEKETNLRKTVWQQPALFVLEYAVYQQLKELDLHPAALAGHSMGELTALTVAGCFSYEDAFRIISKRAACMEKASTLAVDPGAMIAVDVPEEILHEMIDGDKQLFFTNFNSPHQTVVGGGTREVEGFKEKLDDLKYWNRILPVSMAFHSPMMRIIRDDLGDYLAGIDLAAPQVPVISNTTRRPYPDDPAAMREIIVSHLESPVHWRDNITTLWNEYGVRLFVEIGPQDTLCKLLNDIIPGALGVHACYPGKEAESLRKTVATLFARGHVILQDPPVSLDMDGEGRHEKTQIHPRSETAIREIIQREINLFALDGVERYLKPAIVAAIQREIDPSFNRDALNTFFSPGQSGVRLLGSAPAGPVDTLLKSSEPEPEPQRAPLSREEEILEKVIAIIMDATGYERSELAAEMDIRQDLSIRSSRLPIIMDAAEQTFGIAIRLEEFMDVRTIGDFAGRVSEIIQAQGANPTDIIPGGLKETIAAGPKKMAGEVMSEFPIARMVLRRQELVPSSQETVALAPGGHVLLLSLGADEYLDEYREIFTKRLRYSVSQLSISGETEGAGEVRFRDVEGLQEKVSGLFAGKPFSGVVLLSHLANAGGVSPGDVGPLCTGIFAVLQILLKSGQRAFCLHISKEDARNKTAEMLAEGILGLLLAAKMEYPTVHFRSLRNGIRAGRDGSIDLAFNVGLKPIDLSFEDGKIFTNTVVRSPLRGGESRPASTIGPDDVLLISGGARGVTSILARTLATEGCSMILLGRSNADAVAPAGLEIQATLAELREAGARAEYIRCDVTDAAEVVAVVNNVFQRYGRIDGIIHGAGVLRDGFIQLLNIGDFQKVFATKFSGLVNLVEACEASLRFVIGFSSIAALTGNVGQANYCSANRAMASYISSIAGQNGRMTAKTFWLPPIEGIGMAEDPDLKEIIKIKIGENAFLDVAELSEIIAKEIFSGKEGERSVIPVRQLPAVASVVVEEIDTVQGNDWFDCHPFPLIDRVLAADLLHGTLRAERVFSQDRDLWLSNHVPFTWLRHPIVSAIMIVETFFETASLLFPRLQVQQARKISFSRMLECPAGRDTVTSIFCRSEMTAAGETICHVDLGKSPPQGKPGEAAGRSVYFSGQIVMTKACRKKEYLDIDSKILSENIQSVMNKEDILRYYEERSGLTGSYRVLERISHASAQSVIGCMKYPDTDDFSSTESVSYKYPAYLLEGLMQLVGFHAGMQAGDKGRTVAPAAIESLDVFQTCIAGETLLLLGELQEEDSAGMVWEIKGYSSDGKIAMVAGGLRMNWLDAG